MLYVAARSGRLVWLSATRFAVLRPPLSQSTQWWASPSGGVWTERLERYWSLLAFVVPPMLVMLSAVPITYVVGDPLPGVTLIAAALTYVVADMVTGLIRAVAQANAPVDPAHSYQWTIGLLHCAEPAEVDALIRAAYDRSVTLSIPDPAFGTHLLVCDERAITTTDARAAVALAPSALSLDGEGSKMYVLKDGDTVVPPRVEAIRPPRGIVLLAVGLVAVLLSNGREVADLERAACRAAGDCEVRPDTWTEGVGWLLEGLFYRSPDLDVATGRAEVLGWLMTPALVVTFAAIVTVGVRYGRYVKERQKLFHESIAAASPVTALILVALDVEYDAVIEAVAAAGAREPRPDSIGGRAVLRLGRIGAVELVLAQSEEGTTTRGGMAHTAEDIIRELNPAYVVLTGICGGLRAREHDAGPQELGDVVVSTYVQKIDHRKEIEGRTLFRGERVAAPWTLLSTFRAAKSGYSAARVHLGVVLSGNTMVASAAVRQKLLSEFDGAVAIEMELAGIQSAAIGYECHWIMVKGISDWCLGGLTPESRRVAATAAARFVVCGLTSGALPARTR
jgi:nucleoside phosphorylase